MFENILHFPSPYPFTGLFGAILLAYILWHMLTIRPKSSAHWSLLGFYSGVFFFYLLQFLFSTNAQWMPLIAPFGDAFILLGAVGLIRFAYVFPQNDQPREARYVTAILTAIVLFVWWYALQYVYRARISPLPPISPYFWLIVPLIIPCALVIFWRRVCYYALREQPDRSWRSVLRVMFARPVHQAAQAHRHFAFALMVALSAIPFIIIAAFPEKLHVEKLYLDYGFSLSMLLSVSGIAFVYFNHAPHPLTFMVKLVGVALVATFSVAGMLVIELAVFMSAERAFELDLFTRITQQAALHKDFTTLPPNVLYLISRHVAAPPDAPDYRLEYGDSTRVPGWIVETPLHQTIQQSHVRFFLHDREYQAGIDFRDSVRMAKEKLIRLTFVIAGSSLVIIFGFPVFFRQILVSPLNNVLNGVKQVELGNFQRDLPILYDDELGALTTAFNRMTHALHDAGQERIRLIDELARKDLFHSLFEAHSAVMLLIHPDTGKIERANAAAARYYGYALEELQTMSVYQLNQLPPVEINDAMQQAKLAQRNDFEFQHRLASGEIREVEVHTTLISWQQQALLFSIIHDITARKQAEIAMREREAQYRLLAENTQDVIWLMNPTGQFTYVSPSVEKLRGYTPQEVLQQTPEEVLTPESLNIVQTAIANVAMNITQGIRPSQTEPVELEQPCKDGSTVWTEALVQPIFDERGQFGGFLGVTRNIAKRRQAEQALREREALLNAVGEIARIGGWELDVETLLVIWTRETYRIHEIAESDFVPFAEALSFYHPADRPALELALQRAMRDGETFDAEFRFITAKGNRLWVRAIGRPVMVDGRIRRLIGVFQDITDRKQAEAALRLSEEKFRQFFAQMPEYAYMISPDGLILDINAAALRTLGYSREELVGQPVSMIYAPESLPKVKQLFARWQETKRVTNQEIEIVTQAGQTRTVLLNAEAVCDDEGQILHSVSVQTDITKRKQAEDALRASEQQLRLIVEASPLPLFLALTAGEMLLVNQAFCELFGCTREEALTCAPANFYATPERDMPRIITALHAKQSIREWEIAARKTDGTIFDVLLSCELIDYIGQPAVLAIVYDLTERKRTEAAVRETAQRLSLAQTAGQLGIWDWNIARDHLIWDDLMYAIYGITSRTFDNKYDTWIRLIHPDDASLTDDEVQTAIRNHHPFHAEFRIVWPNGQIRHLEAHAIVMYSAEGEPERMIGVNTDITERKRIEDALRANEHQLRLIVEASPLPLLLGRFNGQVLMANQAFCSLFGYTSDVIKHEKNAGDFYANPEVDRPLIRSALMEHGRISQWEVRARKADGSVFDVMLSYETILYDGQPAALAVVYDLTERKRLENELIRARDAAEHAERVKSTFFANVSHHLRTPLNVILGFSELMSNDNALSATYQDYLTLIRQNGKDLLTLINQMLKVSKLHPEELAADDSSQQLLALLENQTPQATLTPQADIVLCDSDLELLQTEMQTIPEEVRHQLAEATRHFDITSILEMIEQVHLFRPALAEALLPLAQNFEYELILKIVKGDDDLLV